MTTQDLSLVVIAASAAIAAIAVALIAVSARGLSREARELAQRTGALIVVLERDLPATIAGIRELSSSAASLTAATQPRLERLDDLADEAEATLVAVREVSSTLNGLVRGPADTVSGVKRSVRVVGEGLASGADRLRRAVTGAADGPGDGGDE